MFVHFHGGLQLNKYFRWFLKEVPLEYKEYAGYARRTMRRTTTNGMRYHPPNWLEYQVPPTQLVRVSGTIILDNS